MARHNFEGEIAFLGMDEDEALPPRPQEAKTGIEKDLDEMRKRMEVKNIPAKSEMPSELG